MVTCPGPDANGTGMLRTIRTKLEGTTGPKMPTHLINGRHRSTASLGCVMIFLKTLKAPSGTAGARRQGRRSSKPYASVLTAFAVLPSTKNSNDKNNRATKNGDCSSPSRNNRSPISTPMRLRQKRSTCREIWTALASLVMFGPTMLLSYHRCHTPGVA